MPSVLIYIAVIVILALSIIAAYYLFKLKNVNRLQKLQIEKNQHAWQEYQDELITDLQFIARAMVQAQCDITEGCLRLKVLMDRLDETLQDNKEFQHIQQHYQQTRRMPTHKAYKALNKKQQFKLDQERLKLETLNSEAVLIEVKNLMTFQFK